MADSESISRDVATRRSLHAAGQLARFQRLRAKSSPLSLAQVRSQCRALVDQVMGEAGLYAPDHAALALLQSEGDLGEAVVILRAFRQTLPRGHSSEVIDTAGMLVYRRISSAFREIPGGQILGPTRDYSQRLLETELASEDVASVEAARRVFLDSAGNAPLKPVRTFSKVTSLLRKEGLLRPANEDEDARVQDITREPLRFPAPRSARLQALARGSTGALMALAYSGMRGQGGDHPTIGEVRVGQVALQVTDPRGRRRHLGRLLVTEAENISKIKVKKKDPVPYLSLGYGLCFGQNETKAICMGMLDRSMRIGGDGAPAISQEFVLYHTEPADAWGSIHSAKLPAHVEFMSELDHLRAAVARKQAKADARAGMERETAEFSGS
jgi:alpha-D-ribose 1-methylphosphonate 5-triphosphate synthase subunit PhnI